MIKKATPQCVFCCLIATLSKQLLIVLKTLIILTPAPFWKPEKCQEWELSVYKKLQYEIAVIKSLPISHTEESRVYIKMCSTRGNKILVSALLYTLINLVLLSHPQSCWETRPGSAMPGQAVSPQAVDTTPTDQIKKTQLRRPDTGSLSTQLSRQADGDTHIHTPSTYSSHSDSVLLTHSTHQQAGQLPTIISPPCSQARLFGWAGLPSFILSALLLCHSNWLSGLQYLSFPPNITDSISSHPISNQKWGGITMFIHEQNQRVAGRSDSRLSSTQMPKKRFSNFN